VCADSIGLQHRRELTACVPQAFLLVETTGSLPLGFSCLNAIITDYGEIVLPPTVFNNPQTHQLLKFY